MHATKLVNKRLLISFKTTQRFENLHGLNSGRKTSLYLTKKYSSHPHLKEPGCLKIPLVKSSCGGKQTTSEFGVTVFFYWLVNESFTSFDTYLVLLEQLALLSNEWSMLKNRLAFCLKKLNRPRFTYYSYTTVHCGCTNAVTPVCHFFEVFLN